MRVVIRLQQSGFKNHPRWKIVVMPQKKNPRGRFLEHVGWWCPRQGKINQREIVVNKERVRYWIAMGAKPSEKVQKFLSYFDLAPKPLIKYGFKTLYEKPEVTPKDYLNLSPYKIKNFDNHLHEFIQQEEEVKFLKQQRMKNELIKQIADSDLKDSLDPKLIQQELQSLQTELQQMNSQINQVDQKRRQFVIKRINILFSQLTKAEQHESFKQKILQGKEDLKEKIGSDKFLRRSLEEASFNQTIEASYKNFEDQIEALKPITKEEFKDYLLSKGFHEAKADKTVRRYFTEQVVVLKIHAIEATTEVPEVEHENQLHLEHFRKNDQVIFPLPNSITPRPDINSYDAADYYEIPQIYDPATQANKAYNLTSVTDKLNPVKREYAHFMFKNVMGRKKPTRVRTQNPPAFFKKGYNNFSTINKPYYMSTFDYLRYTGLFKN
ncbi:30S ribosomal protein S16 (macronuclear) [Tetrahymena thermophila SB210]|uniref:30S ribosomal protein S16 n=1 Tax=Tetrahymena thermophila (strain SB210) TaxID=312017 RepID=I7M3F6_TETTS|nr:30S ribosomal protein S16 [Tetrahymena thermophila SB210]EAS03050.2 30S ribosomal protein S16 [Tetrahymena thermophila SB210]6Z1P_Bp Chain Bp, 30S ribosomal protein S16 [Tetrahymena thermophila SB210]|eukprot:XP_001023295.2 30S ribosomal protein S16 [Tetrahymena thermophila SB210]